MFRQNGEIGPMMELAHELDIVEGVVFGVGRGGVE